MLRMMLYIVLVCSVSIAGSVVFIFFQSSNQATREVSSHVLQLHEQSIQRLQQTFNELDHMVSTVINDYAVQRLVEGKAAQGSAEERGLREYIDFLIREQTSHLPYLAEMCITFDGMSYSICTKSQKGAALLDLPRPSLKKNERSLIPLADREGQRSEYNVAYTVPLSDQTHVIKGSVQLMIELDRVMKDIYGNLPLLGNQLTDSSGALVYARTAADQSIEPLGYDGAAIIPLQWKDRTYILQKRLDLPGAVWFSQITVPQSLAGEQSNAFSQIVLLVVLVLLTLSIFSALLFRHYFMKPLQMLRKLMNRAELGDFKAYWVRQSSREWNELGESYNQMLNRLEELIKQVKREESLKKEAEMEALQYQLNPHFLYNTLNTIKWVAKMHRTPQIAEVVTSLVRLLQASLGKKGDFITIREEMELIRDYMEIQAFRYGDKIRLESEVDPLAKGCLVPRMILQPLIENAIIHGLEPGRQEGWIRIRIWLEMERELLYCQVEDNGVGMVVEEYGEQMGSGSISGGMRERMSGIGLRHIREKINLYYGNGYTMHITGKPQQGTTIRLTMPVHQSEEE
ncbi:HAMP domain-containing protein [Paenibacillus sp. LMG 31456]|uniref:HAMP domain-containing protein n=1 Tax=Paenibacillus foliorum TaxID=2654974 RepID=A0A972JYR2_9BACL|nr:sensor histidine kinase [Paenibacillus foliorum]NOU93804.1 HAMP domain-containing protein [Paenibacillus foliorum]